MSDKTIVDVDKIGVCLLYILMGCLINFVGAHTDFRSVCPYVCSSHLRFTFALKFFFYEDEITAS